MFLIGFILLLVSLYAYRYAPNEEVVRRLVVGSDAADPTPAVFEHYVELRAAWRTEVKDLLQLLIAPLVPVLGIVVGHMFSRQEAAGGDGLG